MAHPLFWARKSFLYAIGNTTPVNLCQSLPPKLSSQVLLLGCGDPRNILYTLSVSSKSPRSHDFTCCDVEPAILARNVLIFSLIVDQCPFSAIWDIYFHMRLDKESATVLIDQCEKLIGHAKDIASWRSSPYGSVLRIGTAHTLDQLRRLWKCYADKDLYTGEGLQHLDSQLRVAAGANSAEDTMGGKVEVNFTASRSAGPFSVAALFAVSEHFSRYWKQGVSPESLEENKTSLPHINTTLAFSNAGLDKWPLHYGADPLLAFHLAPALAPLKGNTKGPYGNKANQKKLASTIRKEFANWCSTFSTFIQHNTVIIRFILGEVLAFTQALHYYSTTGSTSSGQFASPWTAQELLLDPLEYSQEGVAPSSFNVIDTSNLIDHVGLINLLVCTVPLLLREPYSVLLTEALLSVSDDPLTGFSASTITSLSVISILFGLAPLSYITNFTTQSNVHEVASQQMMSSSTQYHERLSWKFPSSGDPHILWEAQQPDPKLVLDPSQLSNVLFQIYLKMFEAEDPRPLLFNPTLQKMTERTITHYVRASLAAFIKFIQTRITTDWTEVMDRFMFRVEGDKTLLTGPNYYQEMLCHLHLRGLYTTDSLRPGFMAPGLDKARSRLSTWKDIPPVVCVLFTVPRKHIKVLEDEDPNIVGTPHLQCEIYHAMGHSAYASLQAVFGIVQVSAAGEQVTIIEDEKGWHGSSPFILIFWVPSWTLMQNPRELNIRLALKSTPGAAKLTPLLGLSLELFLTKMTDTKHVHVLRDRPNAPGELTRLGQVATISTAVTTTLPTAGNVLDVSMSSPAAEIAFDSAKKLHAVSTLTRRWNVTHEKAKEQLLSGKAVATAQVSPCAIKVSFGSFSQDVTFPYPVNGTKTKLRIARKSSYLEIVAQISGYQIPGGYSLNQAPVLLTPTGPVSWNIHYLNLDKLPALDLTKSDSCDSAINVHISLMLSDRERANMTTNETSEARDVLLDVKGTIFAMFKNIVGEEKTNIRVYQLGENELTLHTRIFILDLRLDLSSHTIVADAFAFSDEDAVLQKHGPFPFALPMMFVQTPKDEVTVWKGLLPALAERCRSWEHKPTCEYTKTGKIPLGVNVKQDPLCQCGRGIGTEEFVKVKGWAPFAPFVTRIAFGPLFAVSYLESVGGMLKSFQTINEMVESGINLQIANLIKEICGGCHTTAAKLLKEGKPKMMVCSRCKLVSYCSQKCQKAAWKEHKPQCNVISQLTSQTYNPWSHGT
ncbi:hypothetical protein BDN72DRAFT_813437 [Pluteus cervinus]|uniref:Uncharacterized protein n=1 Tax=Pluteus cervinus TaxID=181527 RepID=A0ACD3B9C4_9AGAR|nr:hypothetical protein BDN72DRAFT_813437 [Pluteus cervinus]